MRVWRIASARHPLYDGSGAALNGGRWNSMGRGPIYAAETYAGALLEILVKVGMLSMPPNYEYIEIEIPAELVVQEVRATPEQCAKQSFTHSAGDKWFDALEAPVLLVPSVVTRVERNVLINPRHPDFSKIHHSEPRPVWWDPRLIKHSPPHPATRGTTAPHG